jgi:hypothetical protein
MKHLKTFESSFKPLSYSGGDVTKMPIIGKIITKPVGTFESSEYNVVEIIKDNQDRDIYVVNQWYKEGRVPNIIHSEMVEEFIPGEVSETSATGGPFIGGGYGGPSAAPGLAGQTIGTNWSSSKSAEPDQLAIPYNPSGANRVFHNIPIGTRKSRLHRSTRDKKRRPGIKDILFKRRQDFTNKEGGVEKPGKVMSFQNFYKDDTTTVKKDESLSSTIGALGMAASSILKPTIHKDMPNKQSVEDTTIKVNTDIIEKFVDGLIVEEPNLITIDTIEPNKPFTGFTLPISILENKLELFNSIKIKSFQSYNSPKLSLKDLDILSDKNLPFHINYFYVRGVDNESGAVLIPILNLNYTNAIQIHGHDIEFNFTRMIGNNYIGAKINF